MIAPIVIGNFSFNAAGLKSKGTAVKISEIIIIIIGKTTKTFKNEDDIASLSLAAKVHEKTDNANIFIESKEPQVVYDKAEN